MTPTEFQTMWNERIPEFPLATAQIDLWLVIHTEDIVQRSLQVTFMKWEREQHKMDEQYLLRYASKTMNNAKSRAAGVKP